MDKQLEKLIAAACSSPEGSQEWRKAMHRLLIELQRLPGIRKSSHPDYLEALNQTWAWVSRKLCREFAPRKELQSSLVKWINGYLYWRIYDLYSSETVNWVSLDRPIGNDERVTSLMDKLSATNLTPPTLDGLDGYIEQLQRQNTQRLALKLEFYIHKDPQGKLRLCYPCAYQQCNCQLLSQRRYLQNPPTTFRELAQELNIPMAKLTNHWYDRCKPLLQEIALDLGYQPVQNNE